MAESTSDLSDWQKCFSKSRQREYYFNSKTGQSLWTWDEVKEACAKTKAPVKAAEIEKRPEKTKKPKEVVEAAPKNVVVQKKPHETAAPKSKTTRAPVVKSSSKAPVSQETIRRQESTSQDVQEMSVDPEEEDEKMEIEIVENIQKFRQDTSMPEQELSASNWTFSQANIIHADVQHRPLVVVLDTNIFIGNLSQIKALESSYSDKIVFVVPWAVLQELDRMKTKEYVDRQLTRYDCASKSLYEIMQKAQQSIFYISQLLELNSRCFFFESAAQSKKESSLIKCISNDDLILKCALVSGESYSTSNLVLLTNDRNLCSKAIISKINALNFKSFRAKLDDLLSHANQLPANIHSANQIFSSSVFQPIEPKATSILKRYSPTQFGGSHAGQSSSNQIDTGMQVVQASVIPASDRNSIWKRFSPTQGISYSKPVNSLSDRSLKEYLEHLACLIDKQLRTVLFDVLSLYYRVEMEKAYGDLWKDLLIHQPPWTLKTLVVNWKKSYKVVFAMDNATSKSRQREQMFERLRDDINSYEKYRSYGKDQIEQMRLAIKAASEAFTLVETYDADYFNEEIKHLLKRLDFLRTNGVKLCNIDNFIEKINLNNLKPVDSDIPVNFQLFEPIWMQYHTYSAFASEMERLGPGVHQSHQYNQDFVFQFNFLICYGSMDHLTVLYEKCLSQTEEVAASIQILSFVFYALYKMLNIDVSHQDQNQNILIMPDMNTELDKYSLIEANLRKCFMPENKETMVNGFYQLNEYKKALIATNPDNFFLI